MTALIKQLVEDIDCKIPKYYLILLRDCKGEKMDNISGIDFGDIDTKNSFKNRDNDLPFYTQEVLASASTRDILEKLVYQRLIEMLEQETILSDTLTMDDLKGLSELTYEEVSENNKTSLGTTLMIKTHYSSMIKTFKGTSVIHVVAPRRYYRKLKVVMKLNKNQCIVKKYYYYSVENLIRDTANVVVKSVLMIEDLSNKKFIQ